MHADQGSGRHLPDSREAPKRLTWALTEAEKAGFQGEQDTGWSGVGLRGGAGGSEMREVTGRRVYESADWVT